MIPKRALKKYLYEYQVPISYKKTLQVIDACVNDGDLPGQVAPKTLMTIKRALESYRRSEGKSSLAQAQAEQSLVERAAEFGDQTAIALLCYSRLSDKDCTDEDRRDGSRLLKQLIELKFPLAFKVSADLAYTGGHSDAIDLYKHALSLPGLDPRTRTECWRSIGHIAFKNKDLISARTYFSKACQEATDPAQVNDCHFYLAQLSETQREVSRQHLEIAAASGLKDAFIPLGMLLLNYFNDTAMAEHWLKLALVTDTTGTAELGLLDIATRTNNSPLGQRVVRRILSHKNAKELISLRAESVKQFTTENVTYTPRAGRWD